MFSSIDPIFLTRGIENLGVPEATVADGIDVGRVQPTFLSVFPNVAPPAPIQPHALAVSAACFSSMAYFRDQATVDRVAARAGWNVFRTGTGKRSTFSFFRTELTFPCEWCALSLSLSLSSNRRSRLFLLHFKNWFDASHQLPRYRGP